MKSISFRNCTPILETDYTKEFIAAIKNTVEIVEFIFDNQENSRQSYKLLKSVIENCCNIQKLIIKLTWDKKP